MIGYSGVSLHTSRTRRGARSFPRSRPPEVIVMDGQKGLFAAAKTLWPGVAIQRCQFHVVSFALQYIGRRPKDEAGRSILDLLYRLKEVKTAEDRGKWITLYHIWEHQFFRELIMRNGPGRFMYPRLRSVRHIIRRALPNLFTYIDHPGVPNTTNLVEGWVNSAVAEALRRHRGLKAYQKKTLVGIVLAHLARKRPQGEGSSNVKPDLAAEIDPSEDLRAALAKIGFG